MFNQMYEHTMTMFLFYQKLAIMKHLVSYLCPFEHHLTLNFKSMRTEWNTIIGKGDKLIKSQQQILHYGSMNENVTLFSVAQALFFVGSDMSMVPAKICWKWHSIIDNFSLFLPKELWLLGNTQRICVKDVIVHNVSYDDLSYNEGEWFYTIQLWMIMLFYITLIWS